jgi:hypothetical protein
MEEFGRTMKAGGKSARTSSPDEEIGVAPSVAKLPIDPNGGLGEFRVLGGESITSGTRA